jgi:hypothetical protein
VVSVQPRRAARLLMRAALPIGRHDYRGIRPFIEQFCPDLSHFEKVCGFYRVGRQRGGVSAPFPLAPPQIE